jgi:hypothetical protein
MSGLIRRALRPRRLQSTLGSHHRSRGGFCMQVSAPFRSEPDRHRPAWELTRSSSTARMTQYSTVLSRSNTCHAGKAMDESNARIVEPGKPPTAADLESWMGKKAYGFWTRISEWISRNYPDVFTPEWLFGGKKHGWYLRYKKSKSFCSLIPEKKQFAIMIVFGADERTKVETTRNELSAATRQAYDSATTYHEGKWLCLRASNTSTLRDVQRLLAVKRRPRPK